MLSVRAWRGSALVACLASLPSVADLSGIAGPPSSTSVAVLALHAIQPWVTLLPLCASLARRSRLPLCCRCALAAGNL